MIHRLSILPAARDDIDTGAEWYAGREPALAADFLAAVDAAVASVLLNPLQYPRIHLDVRRVLLRRFPYFVAYYLQDDEIVVLACPHVRQNPSTWQNRRDS